MSQKILNKRSSVFNKTPLPSQIEVGEIAINFNHENPFLSILDSNGEIQKFLSETKTRGLIQYAKEDIDNSFYTKEEINNMFEAFDPSGEVDLDNYYTKRETDNLLAGKSDTGHTHDYSQILNTPDLSIFATLSDIPSINGLASEVWVGENYQPKGNYLTEHQSLENYYTKSEADNKFLTSHQDLSGYALKSEIPDISDLATKSEIPDTSNFITSAFTEDHYQPKGNYLTEHQSLENYYTKSEADNKFLTSHQDLSDYALKSEIPDVSNFVTSAFTDATYAKKGEAPTDAYTKAETDALLAGKANSAHTHTMSEITDLDVPKTWRGTLAQYNNLTEYDNDTLYIITDSSEQLVTSGDVESMISGYTNLTEVQTLLEGYSQTGHTHDYETLTNKPDLSIYLTEHQDISNLATKAELEDYQPVSGMSAYSQTGHTHDYETLTNKPDLSIYLTEHQDISGLASKQELENYMPNSGMTDYALKSEIPNSYTKTEADNLLAEKANSAHTHTVSDITDLNIPSVEGLASEAWVSQNYQPQSGMSAYSTTAHTHSDLATKAELDDYLTIASASTIYATKEELEKFTPSDNYAGTVWTGTLSEYNNLTVIDTDTLYVITDTNQQYVTSGQVESMTSGYTNLTEVQTLLEGYSTTAHTHSYNDLTDKPTIPSTTGLASEEWVTNNFAGTGHTHSQYLTETSADTRYARVVSITQAEYDVLVQNDQVEQGVLYCIIEQSN